MANGDQYMERLVEDDIKRLLEERKRSMLAFSANYRPLNMYVIYRADLEMSPGKLAAQCGHAFVNVYTKAQEQRPGVTTGYQGTGEGTKIVMYAKSLTTLIRAYRDMQKANFHITW
jgi:peptidyl-tRNA hydrolase